MSKIGFKFIIYICLYVLLTVFLYFYGPLNYNYTNNVQTLILLIIYMLVFVFGYIIGWRNIRVSNRKYNFIIKINNKKKKVLFFSTLISLILGIIQMFDYFGTLNPLFIFDSVISGVDNLSILYQHSLENSLNSTGSLLTQMTTLLSPITFAMLPIGILEFTNIKSNLFKLLWFIVIVINLINNIMTGTNIGVFRSVISVVSVIFILINQNKIQFYTRLKKSTKLLGILLLLFFVMFFLNSVVSRMPETGTFLGNVYINYDNWLLKLLPESIQTGIILMISYLTQGYYGFSLIFDYRWTSTFPFGSSMFLMSYAPLLGIDYNSILSQTYIYKMASHWSPTVNWHTVFTWFANDVGPMGVIFVMLFFGILLGLFFKEAIHGNLSAILLFSVLMIFVVFIPMNNVMLSNPLSFVPFVTYLIIFVIKYKIVFIRR